MKLRSAFFLLLMLSSGPALALDLDFRRHPRQFELQNHSLIHKSLAYSCLSLKTAMVDSLPCSPSLISKEDRPKFYFGGYFSNGFTSLEKAKDVLNGKIEQATVDNFFSFDQILESEGMLESIARYKRFGLHYSPLNVRFLSSIKNLADPLLRLSAVSERTLRGQYGSPLGSNFHFGVQVRYVERQHVIKSFPLRLLGTEEGIRLLTRENQQVLYVEPALSLSFENAPLSPALTGMLANLKVMGEADAPVEEPVEMQFGLSLGLLKDLRFMVDFRSLSYEEEAEQKFHMGLLWNLSPARLAFGWDSYGMSLGAFTEFHHVVIGTMVSTTWVPGTHDAKTREAFHLQMGWRI